MTVVQTILTDTKHDTQTSDDKFFESIISINPFSRNRITDTSPLDSDVTSINYAACERLKSLAQKALQEKRSYGALLFAGAGLGKSHLLARIANSVAGEHIKEKGCFLFIHNLQVSPNDLPRYLLKTCVSKLADDRSENFDTTPLFDICNRAILEAARQEGISSISSANYQDVKKLLMHRLDSDKDVFEIIFQFYFSVRKLEKKRDLEESKRYASLAALAARWLKGENLDYSEARKLNLRVEKKSEEDYFKMSDDQINAAFLTLARLAAVANRQFILCFDQVENMSPESVTALSRFVHSIIDAGEQNSNILIILSGVKDTIVEWLKDGTISEAAADRISCKSPIELARLRRDDAEKILESRLTSFFSSNEHLTERSNPFFTNDTVFPLGRDWLDKAFANVNEFRPRDVLTMASERWESIQREIHTSGGENWLSNWQKPSKMSSKLQEEVPGSSTNSLHSVIDQQIKDRFNEKINERKLNPGELPADAGNLLGLCTQLLRMCEQHPEYTLVRVEHPSNDRHGTKKLKTEEKNLANELRAIEKVDSREIRNRAKFVLTESKTSAAASLRQLLEQPECEHRILVTEDRLPLSVAVAGKKHFESLQSLGEDRFKTIQLSFDDYAKLDSLMAVYGDSKSGDLEVIKSNEGPRSIKPEEVIESFHRQKLFTNNALLQEFLNEPSNINIQVIKPSEQEFRKFVIDRLSWCSGEDLSALVRSFLGKSFDDLEELKTYLPWACDIATQMHHEGVLNAKPWNDDMFVTMLGKK